MNQSSRASVPMVGLTADGPSLSAIVAGVWRIGSWQLDRPARARWIEDRVALGVTSFDLADIYGDYGAEALFGEALATLSGLRERIQLVSKCGIKLVSERRPAHAINSYDTSRAHVLASVDASLRALRTDRLDLLLVHRPDYLMDPDALAATFDELRAAGKVLHFGVSNHSASQLALLGRRVPLATNQIELSPLHLEPLDDGTLDQCVDLGMRPMIWSPLGGGRLFTGTDDRSRRVQSVLAAIAGTHGVSAATIAYAWLLRHPSRAVPIVGSRRLVALQEAIGALEVALTSEEWYRVWEAGAGHPVP
ncbi:MAG: aldo/keto reductase [Gemmatimonadaceae bacterium]|nr:aldo/keto reductase [Gemmatimonadaceae bacterium]NUP71630.1 aldo/keto reductase [Gemmatimonadaceae bacterium]NUS32412.1 aldo/keto reductase [Gemmatimonadaceae bacterium]